MAWTFTRPVLTYISAPHLGNNISILFTFQYGSTYIVKQVIEENGLRAFTFQYGSTYIKKIFNNEVFQAYNLHSSMVLLIWERRCKNVISR